MRLTRLLALPICAFAFLAGATSIAPLSSEDVDRLAARIMEARCIAVTETVLSGTGISATQYTFVVESILKNDGSLPAPGGKLILNQAGARSPAGGQLVIIGMPAYEPGRRYRLALNGTSASGLTSPVGMGLGVRVLSLSGDSAPEAAR